MTPQSLAQKHNDLARTVEQQGSARRLESASVGKGGLTIKDGGSAVVRDGGAFTVLDEAGEVVARYGPLQMTTPGAYGLEVRVGGQWVHVGAQVATWDNLAGKPSVFPPSSHQHSGSDITSEVASASRAGSAGFADRSGDSDGSARAWNETSGPSDRATVSVGSDGKFFKWSSSRRYKTNIRDAGIGLAEVCALRPVKFDRVEGGSTGELGFIAEEVEELFPETVFRDPLGRPDGINYEVLVAPLTAAIQELAAKVAALEARLG